jgi:hypothetical protein
MAPPSEAHERQLRPIKGKHTLPQLERKEGRKKRRKRKEWTRVSPFLFFLLSVSLTLRHERDIRLVIFYFNRSSKQRE